jgi:hypothetical protein
MFAIIPIMILAGGLSVGAFDESKILDTTESTFADNIEMNESTNKVALLDLND